MGAPKCFLLPLSGSRYSSRACSFLAPPALRALRITRRGRTA